MVIYPQPLEYLKPMRIMEASGDFWYKKQLYTWGEMYAQLEAYKTKYGNVCVPTNKKEYPQLDMWLKNQRTAYNKKQLPEDKRLRLDILGVRWGPGPKRGLLHEKAICIHIGIKYNGAFNYSEDEAMILASTLKLLNRFPWLRDANVVHTGNKKEKGKESHDFKYIDRNGEIKYLSAKSTMDDKNDKISPRGGQSQPKKFNDEVFPGSLYCCNYNLKRKIQLDTVRVLKYMEDRTFDCPIIYYVESRNENSLIYPPTPFCYKDKEITWSVPHDRWANSSLLKINGIPVMEIQFHSTSRDNMNARWFLTNTMKVFSKHFDKPIPI